MHKGNGHSGSSDQSMKRSNSTNRSYVTPPRHQKDDTSSVKSGLKGLSLQEAVKDPNWSSVRYNVQSESKDTEEEQTTQEHATSGEVSISPVPTTVRFKFARRPFLHLIVLYGSDPKVVRYSKEVQNSFLDSGIDVYLQVKFGEQFIRTENLAEIIGNSKGDFLVVLGDKNVKNKSVQARRKGKLVECKVEEMINFVWSDWVTKGSTDEKIIEEVAKPTEDQLYSLLEKYTGVRHITERVSKGEAALKELKEWKHNFGHGVGGQPTVIDEMMASKMTNHQKSMIRIHQQLLNALETLQNIPVAGHKTPNNSGRGVSVDSKYTPSELKSGLSENIRDKLVRLVQKSIPLIEQQGNQLLALGSPLWTSYWQEYQKKKQSGKQEEPVRPASPVSNWTCTACTFVNKIESDKCEMCQESKKDSLAPGQDRDGWSLTGAAGRQQRKQQREKLKEEQEAKEKKKEDKKRVAKETAQAKTKETPRTQKQQPQPNLRIQPPQSAWKQPAPAVTSPKVVVPQQQQPSVPIQAVSNRQPVPEQYHLNYPPLSGSPTSSSPQVPSPQPPNVLNFQGYPTSVPPTAFPQQVSPPIEANNQEQTQTTPSYLLHGLWLDDPNQASQSNGIPQNSFAPSFNQQEMFNLYSNWMSAFTPLQSNTTQPSFYAPTQNVGNQMYTPTFAPSAGISTEVDKSQEQLQFNSDRDRVRDSVRQKIGNFSVRRPCCYCGDESSLECTHCAKMGLSTYFCSPEHQTLMWKEHLEFHRNSSLSNLPQFSL